MRLVSGCLVVIAVLALALVAGPSAKAEPSQSTDTPSPPDRTAHGTGVPVGLGFAPTEVARVVHGNMVGVELHVRPWKSQVKLDGKPMGRVTHFDSLESPLWLTPGKHVVELDAPGYESLRLEVDTLQVAAGGVKVRLRKGRGIDPRSVAEVGSGDSTRHAGSVS